MRAAIGVLHALRLSRGARGVVDRDGLLLVLEPALGHVGGRGGEEARVLIFGVIAVDTNYSEAGGRQRCDEGLELGVEQEKTRAAVLEDLPNLRARQPVVDRDENPARRRNPEMRLERS